MADLVNLAYAHLVEDQERRAGFDRVAAAAGGAESMPDWDAGRRELDAQLAKPLPQGELAELRMELGLGVS